MNPGQNQFAAPRSNLNEPPPRRQSQDHGITQTMIDHLVGTRPWVLFFAILGTINIVLTFLAGFVSQIPVLLAGGLSATSLGAGIALGIVYIVIGIIYIPPVIQLYRFSGALDKLRDGSDITSAVEQALYYQKRFWLFAGIIVIALFVIGIFAIIVAIAVASFAGLSA